MSHFCLNCGCELEDRKYVCRKCHHNVYLDTIDGNMVNSASGFLTAAVIEANTQWVKYRCGRDGRAGHGFAAEDYNALSNRLSFMRVQNVGRTNESCGADRISDGICIQTKYYATPRQTVNALFENNGAGQYQYGIQKAEVPSDQYEQCLVIMEEKIRNGQVQGFTDAKDVLVKGACSYQQAKNLLKAGNIDSLAFDAKLGCITALSSMGISFCFKLFVSGYACRNEEDLKGAVQLAFIDCLKNGTISMSTTVLSMQVLRTQFGRNFAAAMQLASKNSVNTLYKYAAGKKLVHDIASGLWNKTITGASAKNVATKLIRTNAITGIATFAVMSIPDTYNCFVSSSISKPQFIKNLVVNATSIAGATIGGFLGMRFGTTGAMIGGMAGGTLIGILSKKVGDFIHKDDNVLMQELIKIALVELGNEHCILSEKEFNEAVELIKIDKAIDTNLLRAMYAVGAEDDDDIARVDLAKLVLDYYFGVVDRRRKTLKIIDNEQLLLNSINEIDI